jgi:hypothetical protein
MDAEDLMSPLFHMPPSTSCFYRVSSSLTTSPSVYDKIKSFLDRKENSVDDKITKPDKEKNPIFKSVIYFEFLLFFILPTYGELKK